MVYKIFPRTDGEYKNAAGERFQLSKCNEAVTPEGTNVGWTEYVDDDAAIAAMVLEKVEEKKEEMPKIL